MEYLDDKNVDRIMRYFDDELPATERLAFEKELNENVALRAEVAFYRDMIQVVQAEGEAQTTDWLEEVNIDNIDQGIRQQLVGQNQQIVLGKKKGNQKIKVRQLNPLRRVFSIAASFLVLVISGTLFYANQNYSNTALANQQYLGADTPGTLSGSTGENTNFQRAITNFKKQTELDEVKSILQSITSTDANYIEAQYFLGHLFYQEKNYTTAIEKYELVLDNTNRPAYINGDKLQWNLLLARLAKGENVDATIDKLIKNGNLALQRKVQELQKMQESFWSQLVF